MKKKTHQKISTFFKITTAVQIAYYGYIYYKKLKNK